MADKVNKEESIARVYQFLNKDKDWKASADKNGDGIICKTEFRTYLLGSGFKFNNGENKEDLVDAFWKSIDSNTKGKIAGGSAINNKNALDTNEIANIENSIEATKIIISFMQDKEAPSGLDAQYRTAWKNSVKQGLIYKASEYLKTGKLEGINEEWLNGAYKLSAAKATADYTATAEISKELGKVEGYSVGDDKTLKGVVDEYVAQLEGNTKDEAVIIEEIKKIVAAYVDTAKNNTSNSVSLLAQYGYDPDDSLNDLQLAVLTTNITSKILDYIKKNYADVYTDEYKDQIEASVKKYVEDFLADKSANEFNKLKEFNVSSFASSDDFKTLVKDIQDAQKKLQDARDELNTYIGRILAEKDSEKDAIVEEVLGSTSPTEIMNKLLAIKTIAELDSVKQTLSDKLDELAAKRTAEAEALKAENEAKYAKTVPGILSRVPDTSLNLTEVDNWNKDTTFKDLYNNDGNVVLYGKMDTHYIQWDYMKNTIRNNMITLGNKVKTMLMSAGLDGAILDKAITNVVNTYCNNGALYYENNDGTDQGALVNNCNNYMNTNRAYTASRIVNVEDTNGKNSDVYMIHFKDFVDDIVNEYNSLADGNDHIVANELGGDKGQHADSVGEWIGNTVGNVVSAVGDVIGSIFSW